MKALTHHNFFRGDHDETLTPEKRLRRIKHKHLKDNTMKNKDIAIMLILFTAFIGLASFAEAESTVSTKNFIEEVSVNNRFEVESSELALKKTQSLQVRTLAERILEDQNRIQVKLKAAVANGMENTDFIVKELGSEQKAALDDLAKTPAETFDQEFIKAQMDVNNANLEMLTRYSESGENEQLKTYSKETIPALEQHSKHIDQVRTSL